MHDNQASPDLAAVRYLPDLLAEALDATIGEVVGLPLSLAFRVRTDARGALFLSGLDPTTAEQATRAFGGRLLPVSATQGGGHVPAGTFGVVAEAWQDTGAGPVGTGPVALSPAAWTGIGPPDLVTVVAGARPTQDRPARVAQLRDTLGSTADRLDAEVATEVDWGIMKSLDGPSSAWLELALDHMARTRSAVGAYLIEVADDIDDERIDQLGDGYVRAAELWRELPNGGAELAADVHELERACVGWMRSAAQRPTRYAF